jgi:predicted Zn-dependent protease
MTKAFFFQQLEQEGSYGPQFLRDHPNPGNRLQAIEREIANWPSEIIAKQSSFVTAKQEARYSGL